MNIISDEREIKTLVVCENCQQEKPGRAVEARGMVGESRGWYKMCFDCFGPRIFWTDREHEGRVMESPANLFAMPKIARRIKQVHDNQ